MKATAVAPTIEFDPPPAGNLAAYAVVDPETKSISAITVINPAAHTYADAPAVRVRGGTLQPIGFFEAKDTDTRVAASAQSGMLTVIGNLCRTEFANNISQPGDVLLVNNGKATTLGQPYVKDASVSLKVMAHRRGAKIIVYKMRPKKKTRRKNGHRQELTRVMVESISVGGKSIS